MSMNRKRLAITAAVIGAIAYPLWTGSWSVWGSVRDDIERSGRDIWVEQEDEQAAARLGVTVAQMRADQTSKCIKGVYEDPSLSSSSREVRNADAANCYDRWGMWVPAPSSIFKLWRLGIPHGLKLVGQWLMDVLLGSTVAAALSYFGPRLLLNLLTAWLRWVREEERMLKDTADSANLRTPVKNRTNARNISAAIMGLLFARIFATYFSYLGPGGEIIGAAFGGFLGAGFTFIIAGLMSKRKQLHNGDILPADNETAAERADRVTDR
ncbi:MAG: hypothetical protein WBF43_13740 [Methylocella sp.]